MKSNKSLSTEQQSEILNILQERFHKNMLRHDGLDWAKIQSKLEAIYSLRSPPMVRS